MLRRIAVLTVALGLSVLAATALAASLQLRTHGGYAPKEKWVENHTSAAVNLIVTDHGKTLSKRSGLSCDNNGMAPLDGSPGVEFSVHLPHSIPISPSGHFAFRGIAKVSAYEDQTQYPVTTEFSLSGSFRAGKIVTLKTIAATGSVSDNYCKANTATQFKLIYDPEV